MLHAVTFDFWQTLYRDCTDGSVRARRLRLLEEALARHAQPRSWEALEEAHQRALCVWERIWREEWRTITVERWLEEMLSSLDAQLPERVLEGLRLSIEEAYLHGDSPRPIPGVAEVLPRLSRRYRLGLVSDVGLTPGRVIRELLQRDGLLDCFRALTFSDESGEAKPAPGQFLRTLAALGVEPEEAAHVGDLPETDLAGARAVGMKAILFLGASRREDGRSLADAAFEDYDQLEGLLETLG